MAVSEYKPTVADVGALMFARAHGEYTTLETFTADTKPTAGQVTAMIDRAADLVSAQIGVTVHEELRPAAKTLVTLMAALLIEPGHFPEQARPERSAWEQWRELYQDGIKALVEAIQEKGAGGDAGPADDAAGAAWSFPAADPVVW
jgi:hypothetical protein